jgi:hypothetical protein
MVMNHETRVSSAVEVHGEAERALTNFFGAGLVLLSIYVIICYSWNSGFSMPAFLGKFLNHFGSVRANSIAVILAAVVGLLASTYWEIKKPNPATLEKHQYWMSVVVRYTLAFVFLTYGISKVLGVQFSSLLSDLEAPLGETSGFTLAWRFFEYSYAYQIFIALPELIAPFLLFFRRTTTLGALVLLPVVSNIVVLNITHKIGVTFFSSSFLVLALFLLVPEIRRLTALLTNAAFPARIFRVFYRSKGLTVLKYLVVVVILVFTLASNWILHRELVVTSPLHGSWDVQDSKINGKTPDASDLSVWKKFYLDSDRFVEIRRGSSGRLAYFTARLNPQKQTIILKMYRREDVYFEGSYKLDENGTLLMEGRTKTETIQAILKRAGKSR